MRSNLLLALLLIAPALVRAQQDDLEKLRAQRKAEILAVADNPSLTLEQKQEIIKGIRKGYSKRIHDLPANASSGPAPTIAGPAPEPANPGADARAQLRAQRKAEILAIANDKSLTLDQQKEKISALRASWHKGPDADAPAPASAAAISTAAAPSPAPVPAPTPSRPVGRAQGRKLDDRLLP